jgi:hypothetical protein
MLKKVQKALDTKVSDICFTARKSKSYGEFPETCYAADMRQPSVGHVLFFSFLCFFFFSPFFFKTGVYLFFFFFFKQIFFNVFLHSIYLMKCFKLYLEIFE